MEATTSVTPDQVQALCDRIMQHSRQQLLDVRNMINLNEQILEDLRLLGQCPEGLLEASPVAEAMQVLLDCGSQVEKLLFKGIALSAAVGGTPVPVYVGEARLAAICKRAGQEIRSIIEEPVGMTPEEFDAQLDGQFPQASSHLSACDCSKCHRRRLNAGNGPVEIE
jgi:hypothetical protein